MRAVGSRPDREALEALRDASTLEEMREALLRAQKRLAKKVAKTDEMVEAVYTAARDAAFAYDRPTRIAKPRARAVSDEEPEVALFHLTDWQFGKSTESYGRDVCTRRIRQVIEKGLRITDLHRKAIPVTRCDVMFGGDMVEGVSIFPGQVWEVDAPLYDQLFGVSHLMTEVVESLAAEFDEVHVWTEYGNHGRIGKYGEMKADDNVDRMAYGVTREALERSGLIEAERVVWHESDLWYNLVEIGGYRALLVHGDEIRSFGGNHPSYGITKKVNGWASGVIEEFHDCYMGHFHRPDTYTLANGGTIYITGTPESGNEYAREFVAATGIPQQRLHFVSPSNAAVTAEYRIRCT